ncbi:MAG: hypothetical protein ACE5ID_09045 [Acidobacteriota bacterium]
MTRRTVPLCTLLLLLPVLSQVRADKLVVFHNGRTLRATEVRQDGDWSFLTLGRGSELGVPNRLIAAINEVQGTGSDALPNVQASAGGSSAPPAGGPNLRHARPVAAVVGARPGNTGVRHQVPQGTAAQARRDALRRAASQAYGGRAPTPAQVRSSRAGQAPTGVNLSEPAGSERWPSLLDQRRAARERGKGKGRNDR